MDKVYRGCMLVDENELELMLIALGGVIRDTTSFTKSFNDSVKLYAKLLEEKESISREREKHESQTETESI